MARREASGIFSVCLPGISAAVLLFHDSADPDIDGNRGSHAQPEKADAAGYFSAYTPDFFQICNCFFQRLILQLFQRYNTSLNNLHCVYNIRCPIPKPQRPQFSLGCICKLILRRKSIHLPV